jgi:hypothetical protein
MRVLLFTFCFLLISSLVSCGSSAGGGGTTVSTGTGGGAGAGGGIGGGGAPGTRGPGANAPGDPVTPGGGTGAGGNGGPNDAPIDAVVVDVLVPPRGARTTVSYTATANSNGTLNLLVNVINPQNQSTGGLSLQSVTFSSSQNDFFTERFSRVGGNTLVQSSDSPSKTLAVLLSPPISRLVNSLPYPTRGRDQPLTVDRYLQRIRFLDAPSTDVTGRIVLKNDPGFQAGVLKANVFLQGNGVINSRNEIQESIAVWVDVYARIGIAVDFLVIPQPGGPSSMPNPGIGSPVYETSAQQFADRQDAVNVHIGSVIQGASGPNVLGVSGGIPGPYFPSQKSAVIIGLEAHQGLDGFLSSIERRVMGETIAHEVGHYLGLFHPVERDLVQPGVFSGEDPLGDTPVCVTINECIAIGLTSNLMFPITFDPNTTQQNLTPEQADVMNIQAIVN